MSFSDKINVFQVILCHYVIKKCQNLSFFMKIVNGIMIVHSATAIKT
jgi:hypothetical protein